MTRPADPDLIVAPPAATGAKTQKSAPGRDRLVVAYIVLAIMALVPGIVGVSGLAPAAEPSAQTLLAALHRELQDISFGRGLRFWLGVAGTTLLVLLLLYPLRKVLAGRRELGSVAGWFHLHMLMGLMAPVLILYHANFGPGSLNSNVALATMLLVVVSGIAGHFVHARANARLHGHKQSARQHLDTLVASLATLEGPHASKRGLVDRLGQFEAGVTATPRSILGHVASLFSIALKRHEFLIDIDWLIAAAGDNGSTRDAQSDHRRRLREQLNRFLAALAATAGKAIAESLWSTWRLMHTPVYLVMLAAIALHVAAVWNLDRPVKSATLPATEMPTPIADPAASRDRSATRAAAAAAIKQVRRPTIAIETSGASTAPSPASNTELTGNVVASQSLARPPDLVVTATVAPVLPAEATKPPPAPTLARRPAPRSATAQEPVETRARPAEQAVAPAEREAAPLYAELQRRIEAPQMGLGAPKPQSLIEHFALWKAKMEAKQFAHSLQETGFELTGKHARAECKSCHTTPPAEAKKDNPRQCIACHKTDDIHRGRRPDCVQCHTTNRWSEIVKRR